MLRRVVRGVLRTNLVQFGCELVEVDAGVGEHLGRGTVGLLQDRFKDVVAADRRFARELELSVTDETVTVVLRDPRSIELGKQIIQLNGGPLTARGPQLDLLSRLWTAVNGWLAATARTLAPPPEVSPEVGEQLFGRGVRSRFRRRKAG